MSTKKSKIEIFLEVLFTIKKGINKITWIMHETNLSYRTVKNILNALIKQNIIIENYDNSKKPIYIITNKGINIIDYFKYEKINNNVPVPQKIIRSKYDIIIDKFIEKNYNIAKVELDINPNYLRYKLQKGIISRNFKKIIKTYALNKICYLEKIL